MRSKKKSLGKRSVGRPRLKKRGIARVFQLIRPTQILMHLSIAGTAIVALLLLGSIDPLTFATLRGEADAPREQVEIGLEFDRSVALEMLFARKGAAGYLSIENPSDSIINVSVPAAWNRTEVRGKPIADFAVGQPDFGFRRWTMPPQSGMNMLLPSAPSDLLFSSPSETTAAITLRSVDLGSSQQFINVVLLNKQVEARLWEE